MSNGTPVQKGFYAKQFIQGAIKNPGSLRKALKAKKGKKIPASKLEIKEGDTTLMKRRKNLAKTLSKISHYKH